jgi:hypothetical protein
MLSWPSSAVLGLSVHCHVQVSLHTGLQGGCFMLGAKIWNCVFICCLLKDEFGIEDYVTSSVMTTQYAVLNASLGKQ